MNMANSEAKSARTWCKIGGEGGGGRGGKGRREGEEGEEEEEEGGGNA